MARVWERRCLPITRQPRPSDTIFRQPPRLLLYTDARRDGRAKLLAARVPGGRPLPTLSRLLRASMTSNPPTQEANMKLRIDRAQRLGVIEYLTYATAIRDAELVSAIVE